MLTTLYLFKTDIPQNFARYLLFMCEDCLKLSNQALHQKREDWTQDLFTRSSEAKHDGKSSSFFPALRGYHNYKSIKKPSVGKQLVTQSEFGNQVDKFAIKAPNGPGQWQRNNGPSTTRVSKNSMVFSRSNRWRIYYS